MIDRDDWPVHQPRAWDAPIPGVHWYSGCEPGGDWDSEVGRYTGTGPRVNPATGVCEGCGEAACRVCGRESCMEHVSETELARRVAQQSDPGDSCGCTECRCAA